MKSCFAFIVSVLTVQVVEANDILNFPNQFVAPESFAALLGNDGFVLGSLFSPRLFTISEVGAIEEFAVPEFTFGTTGIFYHKGLNRVYACGSNARGPQPYAKLFAYNLDTNEVEVDIDLSSVGGLDLTLANDLTVTDAGDAYITMTSGDFVVEVTAGGEATVFSQSAEYWTPNPLGDFAFGASGIDVFSSSIAGLECFSIDSRATSPWCQSNCLNIWDGDFNQHPACLLGEGEVAFYHTCKCTNQADYLLVGAAVRSNSLFRVSRKDPTQTTPVDFGDDTIWENNFGIDGLRIIYNEGGVSEAAAAVYFLPFFDVQILKIRSEDDWATASVIGTFANPTDGTYVSVTVTDDGDVWALSTDLSGVSGADLVKVLFEDV